MPLDLEDLVRDFSGANAPGLVVGISHAGIPIYRKGWGLASLEHGVANCPDTRLPIASATKQMTCAVVRRLETLGRLGIDDPVARWLPEHSEWLGEVTLRQLMNHTAGVRCYLDQSLYHGYARLPPGESDRLQARLTTSNFAPGTASLYSNGGYRLLSWVIERAAKLPLAEAFAQLLFEPLGMFATDLPRHRWSGLGSGSEGYLCIGDGAATGWRPGLVLSDDPSGDGGVVSTVDDLLRWASALRSGTGPLAWQDLVPPEVDAGDSVYGLGIIMERWRGVTLVHHAGGLPGSSSTILMVPEEDLDIVVLANRPVPTVDLSLQIVERLLGDRLPPLEQPPRADAWPELIGTYLGDSTGLMLEFGEHDGALALGIFGGRPASLMPRAQGRNGALPFAADVGTGSMRFRQTAGADAIDYFDGRGWHRAHRITGPRPSPTDLANRLSGAYENTRVGARLSVSFEDDQLWVQFCGRYGGARFPATGLAPGVVRFKPTLFPGGMLLHFDPAARGVDRVIVSTSRTWETPFDRLT